MYHDYVKKSMPKVKLAELAWVELEEIAPRVRLGIVPIGAIEPYGPHLPMSTDGIVAEWIALKVAERYRGIVTPLLFLGNSALFSDFPGTMSISDAAIYELLQGVGAGLRSAGFTELLVINGHAGNSPAISKYLANEAVKLFQKVLQIDVWRLAESLGQDLFAGTIGAFTHAGPCATSIMMAVAPHLVNQDAFMACEPVTPRLLPGSYAPVPFRTLYPKAYAGDVKKASPEVGKLLLERMVDYIIKTLESVNPVGSS